MVIWLFMTWLHVISSVVWNNFIDPALLITSLWLDGPFNRSIVFIYSEVYAAHFQQMLCCIYECCCIYFKI